MGGTFIRPWEAFDRYADEYDAWYDRYRPAYESELLALKKFLPDNLGKLKTLEIGTGTGRFAYPLGIGFGLDPSGAMAKIAKKRDIETVLGVAEFLPFKKQKFDLILIVTAIAFFNEPNKAIRETFRILKPGGQLIAGVLDRDSPPGNILDSERNSSKFSYGAHFLSATEISMYMIEAGFEDLRICQTLFKKPEELENVELPENGCGEGIFAVLSARKPEIHNVKGFKRKESS